MSQKKTASIRAAVFLPLVLAIVSPSAALNHTVGRRDTLFGLSLKYDIPLEWIVRANGLEGETIQDGQELFIPTDGLDRVLVRPGDTVSGLALLFDVDQGQLVRLNGLDDGEIRIGQELRLPPMTKPGMHRVAAGDTLIGIAARYGISADKLAMLNSIAEDDVIHPGQELLVVADRPDGHVVGPGESIWTIARRYHVDPDDLKSWNRIGDRGIIHPGDVLALYPGLEGRDMRDVGGVDGTISDIALAAISEERPNSSDSRERSSDLPRFGEYFYDAPHRSDQPNDDYWEESDASPLTDYHRSLKVFEEFRSDVAAMSPLGNSLSGWHIVIDPGHGGLDPGAIVTVRDGNGNPLTVTEDEYAYDVSLRLYRALVRHGASASLTLYAPDHHVRDGENARQTFVHRKNEVYADEAHNGNAGWRPVGTVEGLDLRKAIASASISETSSLSRRKGTLFISIHADNSPDLPAGRAVLFDGADEGERESSREFAAVLAAGLGAGSFIKEQPLRVLRENPADAAVLVEVRNIHYDRNCWALRSASLREQDARMIADGILDWADR